MSGPRRLWSGDWMAESAAARSRMAERRAVTAVLADDATDEHKIVPAPPRRSLRDILAAAWLSLMGRAARRRAGGGKPLAPRTLRTRLILIAVIAGVAGAGAMVGVEAATGAGDSPATRAYLGVELGPPVFGQSGALVELVDPGGPAQAAGVMIGDVITAIGGRPVTSASGAVAAIDAQSPGATVTVGIDRLGAPMTLTVTLGSRAAESP